MLLRETFSAWFVEDYANDVESRFSFGFGIHQVLIDKWYVAEMSIQTRLEEMVGFGIDLIDPGPDSRYWLCPPRVSSQITSPSNLMSVSVHIHSQQILRSPRISNKTRIPLFPQTHGHHFLSQPPFLGPQSPSVTASTSSTLSTSAPSLTSTLHR